MKRLIIVSNRLPVSIQETNGKIDLQTSVGGLTTGMKSIYKNYDSLWFGWSGFEKDSYKPQQIEEIEKELKKEKCIPIYLEPEDIDYYYYGFSNETIWPLFHYFMQYTEYRERYWKYYEKVNQKFCDSLLEHVTEEDTVWIHDYHLLLLPKMLREKLPNITIGFFLHIPFPSYEVYRLLPWRQEMLEGMLGADLVGFHTYDYERHFLSCVRRLIGYDITFNKINLGNRYVKVDNFPMGIDYEKFHGMAREKQQLSIGEKPQIQQDIEKHLLLMPERKLILSIDRLDYSKGIPNRLYAYEHFLEKYPEYKEKTTLIMLATPTRSEVERYQIMKSEVDELVGRINGRFGTTNWTPIWYFYRSMPFEDLVSLYISSEIALITPIRDGMNLIAKEYVASRVDEKGVLILSEMAGASKEMSEALIINPNNYEEIADAIKEAYLMPKEEQMQRNKILQERLKRYTIVKWAQDFFNSLVNTSSDKQIFLTKKVNKELHAEIVSKFKNAKKRILFLDYDGTLTGFKNNPLDAKPDKELYSILDSLRSLNNTDLVLISGRDKDTFNEWFAKRNYSLVVEHGVWYKKENSDWEYLEKINGDWKEIIRPSIEFYVDRTPGSFLEEKSFSLAWHYRKSDPELGNLRANELKDELTSLVANHNLEIMEGNKVIEIKNSGINKGRAAVRVLGNTKYDFIFGIGDDWTDEYLFQELPDEAITIKVGSIKTEAKYYIESFKEVRNLLKSFIE